MKPKVSVVRKIKLSKPEIWTQFPAPPFPYNPAPNMFVPGEPDPAMVWASLDPSYGTSIPISGVPSLYGWDEFGNWRIINPSYSFKELSTSEHRATRTDPCEAEKKTTG